MGSGGSTRRKSEDSPSSKKKRVQKTGKNETKDADIKPSERATSTPEVTVDGEESSDVNGTSTKTTKIEIERNSSENEPPANSVVTLRTPDGKAGSSSAKAARRMSFYDTVDAAEILPGLVVGNLASARNPGFLKGKNIGFILNLTTDSEAGGNARMVSSLGIEHLQIQIEDDEDEEILGHFDVCFEFINKGKLRRARSDSESKKKHMYTSNASKTVLVHSNYGLSRTSAVVLAYLMKEKEWSLKEANEHLRKLRPAAKPNDGFAVQLMRYERELHGSMSMTLKDFYKQP